MSAALGLKNVRKELRLIAKCPVYFAQAKRHGEIKIGFSTQVANRIPLLTHERMTPVALLGWVPGGIKVEREMHAKFAEFSLGREWFESAPELMAFIESSTRHDEPPSVVAKYGRITDWGYDSLLASERTYKALVKQESESMKARRSA